MKIKYLLPLMLLLLVGCEEELRNQSRTCTLNDEPVDCKVLDGQNASNKIYKVKAQSRYQVDFENGVLETFDQDSDEARGEDGDTCEVFVNPLEIKFELLEGSSVLRLYDEESEMIFDKISTEVHDLMGLYGKWKMRDSVLQEKYLNILDNGVLEVLGTCKL